VELLSRCTGEKALEIGATDFFQLYLKNTSNFKEVWGTIFSTNIEEKFYRKTFAASDNYAQNTVVSLNLEHELFPVSDENFDLVLLCEVIEHMDIDPMFCLYEINRIMKFEGTLLLTTPNSCSARIAHKVCAGYRPHFFMHYEKNRSPYRHNFEHDVHSLVALLEGAGFAIETLETHDVFEPTDDRALDFLRKNNLPMDNRGDDIFILARKSGPPRDRWPENLYV
jgi:SAM-dependent methyltransferase